MSNTIQIIEAQDAQIGQRIIAVGRITNVAITNDNVQISITKDKWSDVEPRTLTLRHKQELSILNTTSLDTFINDNIGPETSQQRQQFEKQYTQFKNK